MFLILLGDVGRVPLPSENFLGFLIGPGATAAETDTVLTLHSATLRGPKIVALSFTLTSSSTTSSVSRVLILLSVILMISAEFTLNTWFFRLFFNSPCSRTTVRVWKGLDVGNVSSDGLGELFVAMRFVRDPIDHFFSAMLVLSLKLFVELKLSGNDLRDMKVGSGCLRSTSFRETLIVAVEEIVTGRGWEVSTLKVGGGDVALSVGGGEDDDLMVGGGDGAGGGVSSLGALGGEEGEGGVDVSVS